MANSDGAGEGARRSRARAAGALRSGERSPPGARARGGGAARTPARRLTTDPRVPLPSRSLPAPAPPPRPLLFWLGALRRSFRESGKGRRKGQEKEGPGAGRASPNPLRAPGWGRSAGDRTGVPPGSRAAQRLDRAPIPALVGGRDADPPSSRGPGPPRRPATPRASPPVPARPGRIGTCHCAHGHPDAARLPGRPFPSRGKEGIAPRRARALCVRVRRGVRGGERPRAVPSPKGRSAGRRAPGSGSGQCPSRALPLPRRRDGAPGGQEGALKGGRRALVPAAPARATLWSTGLRKRGSIAAAERPVGGIREVLGAARASRARSASTVLTDPAGAWSSSPRGVHHERRRSGLLGMAPQVPPGEEVEALCKYRSGHRRPRLQPLARPPGAPVNPALLSPTPLSARGLRTGRGPLAP